MTGLVQGDGGSDGGAAGAAGGPGSLQAEVAALKAELAERDSLIAQLRAGQARESQIRLVADSLPVLISYIDAGQRYRFNNKAYERWFDRPRRELFGRHLREVLGEPAYEALRPLVERALAGERVSADLELPYRDGGDRFVHLEYVPERQEDGTVAGFYALVQDISESKRAEAELRESEARFRAMADCAPAPVWVTGPNGIEFVNRAFVEVAGMPADELTGETWMNLIHCDDLPEVLEKRAEAWATHGGYAYFARFRRADGEWRWMQVSCSPRLDEAGALLGYVGMAVDLTEQKRAEDELRESEARFRAMADSAPLPVWVTNEAGIEFANRTLCEFTGLAVEELRGPAWMELAHPDDLAEVQARRTEAWATKSPYDFEARFRRADGEWRWLRASCKPRETAGAFVGYVGMAVDVTESRRTEDALRESEARFREVANAAPVLIWLADTDNRGVWYNKPWLDFTGRTMEQELGHGWLDGVHPDDRARAAEICGGAFARREPFRLDFRLRRADGEWRVVDDSAVPRFADDGTFLGYIGSCVDVTDARRSEEALRESEARFRALAENIPTLCWMADETGSIFWYNRRWYEYTGTEPEQMEGWGWQSVHHPETLPAVVERWKASIATGERFEMVFPLRSADGSFRPFLTRVVPLRDEEGRTVRWFGTNVDIAEVKQLETALREESRTLETVNRVGAGLAGELDLERVVQMVTDAGVELSGAQFGAFFYNVTDESGESYMLFTVSGVDRSAFGKFPMPRKTAIFAPTFDGVAVVRSDDITRDPRYGKSDTHHGMPKEHLPVRSYLAVPVISRSGEVIGGLFFGHAEAGRFSDRHEQLLVGVAGQAAVAIDNARLFEAAQRELAERARAEEALRELNQSLEARIAAAIAEREQAEEALRQSQKMEAVGQLTGGIAHDFNNLLTVIAGNLDVALRRLGETGDARVLRALGNALVGAERAATLTQRLLAFSRRQPLDPRPVDPNRLVSGMSELLHRTLGETVTVRTVLGPDLWSIEVDPHQLENALLNLAVNARDAMPDGGTLVIETANVELDEDYVRTHAQVPPGDYVGIFVADTGCGMDEDTLARAVEPFFTTKDVGRGTGLGLSMVYGFVKQSGGHFRILSERGRGTTAKIFLPRLRSSAAAEEPPAQAEAPGGSGGETVLVCEDDADVRAYTVEVLRELGYRTMEADDGPAALELLRQPGAEIDLLLTDVVLPSGMSGAAVAEQARAIRPGLRILFTTGYARDAIVHDGRLDPGVELIAKPFAFADLAARVREMLDRS